MDEPIGRAIWISQWGMAVWMSLLGEGCMAEHMGGG